MGYVSAERHLRHFCNNKMHVAQAHIQLQYSYGYTEKYT